MNRWSVSIVRTAPRSSDFIDASSSRVSDRLFDLHEELAEHAPAVSFDDSTISIRLAFSGRDPVEVAGRVADVTQKALSNVEASVARWPITHVEVTEWTQFEKALDKPNVPAVVGVAELASLLGVSRQRASELARVDHFPKPFTELASGPIWLEPNVKYFLANWERKPGRPKRTVGG